MEEIFENSYTDVNRLIENKIIDVGAQLNTLQTNHQLIPTPDYICAHTVEELRETHPEAVITSHDPHEYHIVLTCVAQVLGSGKEKVLRDLTHELDHFKGYVAVMPKDSDSKEVTFGLVVGYDLKSNRYGWRPFFIYPRKDELSAEQQYVVLDLPEHKSPRDLADLSRIV